jgi:TonB family protein
MSLTEEAKPAAQDAAQKRTRTVFAVHLSLCGKEWEIVMSVSDRAPLRDALLPKTKPPWKSFSLGAFLQTIVVLVVLSVPLLFPDRVINFRNYMATIIAPSPEVVSAWKPQPPRSKRLPSVRSEPRISLPVTRTIPAPVASVPVIDRGKQTFSADAPDIPSQRPVAFALDTPTVPNLEEPRPGVQMGGFGDPNGLPNSSRATRGADIARLGSFNLPFGAVGRGEDIATSQGSGPTGAVRQGLFPDENAARVARRSRKSDEVPTRARPVEILFKPTPIYSSAALSKKIEGDVLLEVRFSGSGQPTVLRVVRGLGYGLDESAEAAAAQIKFRPAQNDEGLPVDSIETVHIVFQLAY